MQRGIPFDVKLPSTKPVGVSALTESELNEELEKGYWILCKVIQNLLRRLFQISVRIMAYEVQPAFPKIITCSTEYNALNPHRYWILGSL